jgi:hemoglobin
VMSDARLNANPRVDEAHHRVLPAGFKYHVTELVSSVSSGPQTVQRPFHGDSHRHLMITDGEWQAFMDDLRQSFDRFDIPEPERQELVAIVESTKETIAVALFQEKPVGKPAREDLH